MSRVFAAATTLQLLTSCHNFWQMYTIKKFQEQKYITCSHNTVKETDFCTKQNLLGAGKVK